MGLMNTFDSLTVDEKAIVHSMSDAAREALREAGTKPRNDDHVAIFDEACAKYYVASAAQALTAAPSASGEDAPNPVPGS